VRKHDLESGSGSGSIGTNGVQAGSPAIGRSGTKAPAGHLQAAFRGSADVLVEVDNITHGTNGSKQSQHRLSNASDVTDAGAHASTSPAAAAPAAAAAAL